MGGERTVRGADFNWARQAGDPPQPQQADEPVHDEGKSVVAVEVQGFVRVVVVDAHGHEAEYVDAVDQRHAHGNGPEFVPGGSRKGNDKSTEQGIQYHAVAVRRNEHRGPVT